MADFTKKIRLGKDKRIVLASNNAHKISEIRHLMEPFDLEILSMKEVGIFDDIAEDGTTFEENSRIKAEYIFDRYGYQTIADDSGLEVYALGGEPGVYSARYAGEEKSDENNNALLLKKLQDLESHREVRRDAKFVSVITMIYRNEEGAKTAVSFRGEVNGMIIDEPRGSYGFGYDPIFEINGVTMAEYTEEEKNRISHRAEAMRKLLEAMTE